MMTGTFRLEVMERERDWDGDRWVPVPEELVPVAVSARIGELARLGNNYGAMITQTHSYKWRRFVCFHLAGLRVEALADERHLAKLESMRKVADSSGIVPADCMAGFFPGESRRHRPTPLAVAVVLAGAKVLPTE